MRRIRLSLGGVKAIFILLASSLRGDAVSDAVLG
jgi:hypothetical protein